MIWATLALLGVPIWLLVGALIGAMFLRHNSRAQRDVVPLMLRAADDDKLRMNSLLNRLIDDEVGVDDGSFLPTGTEHPCEVERWDV